MRPGFILYLLSHDGAVSQSVGLVAKGSRVRGFGSCNAGMLATGSLIHKNENLTGCDGYAFE